MSAICGLQKSSTTKHSNMEHKTHQKRAIPLILSLKNKSSKTMDREYEIRVVKLALEVQISDVQVSAQTQMSQLFSASL